MFWFTTQYERVNEANNSRKVHVTTDPEQMHKFSLGSVDSSVSWTESGSRWDVVQLESLKNSWGLVAKNAQ